MGKYLSLIIAAAAVIPAPSCNNDVFTQIQDFPEVTDITVEGDGGEWSAAFSKKGLTAIHFDCGAGGREYLTYYDTKGHKTDSDCPASELGSIVYENPKAWYSIGFSGKMIYITSHYNAVTGTGFSLRLEYGGGDTRTVNVTITQGERLRVLSALPEGKPGLTDNWRLQTHTTTFANNSSLTQRMEVMPYLEASCSDMAVPAESWADGLELDIPMLSFDGTDWIWKEYKDIVLGRERRFTPGAYVTDRITVDVPPHTKAKLTYTLHYTLARQGGVVNLISPFSRNDYNAAVAWTSVYATS